MNRIVLNWTNAIWRDWEEKKHTRRTTSVWIMASVNWNKTGNGITFILHWVNEKQFLSNEKCFVFDSCSYLFKLQKHLKIDSVSFSIWLCVCMFGCDRSSAFEMKNTKKLYWHSGWTMRIWFIFKVLLSLIKLIKKR